MAPWPRSERERLHEAVVDVVVERGYAGATVEEICERSGLSPATFARHYAGLPEAMIDAYWRHTNEFNEQLRAAYESCETWRDSLRAAAYAAAFYLRDNPKPVRFGTLMMFEAGSMAQTERETHLHQMVELIDQGRWEMEDPAAIDRSVAEGVLGAIYESVIRMVQGKDGAGSPPDRVPELMYIAVRPYLGQAAAREELRIDPPDGPVGRTRREERERIFAAMTDLVLEQGYEAVSEEEISRRAGIQPAVFRHHFANVRECFLAVFDRNNELFGEPIFAAFDEGLPWREALRVAAYRSARFLREHPRETAFNTMAGLGAGDLPQAKRDELLQRIIDLIDRGREELPDPAAVNRGVAEGVMGSVYQMLVRELQQGHGTKAAEDFVPELMYIAVRPYLGQDAAREELSIPQPEDTYYGYRGDRG